MPINYEMTGKHTGRTTRMLQAAIDAVEEGKAVYVVGATLLHAHQLREHALVTFPGQWQRIERIKFESWDSVGNLDPATMRLRGAWPNVRVLADHAAIACEFGALLKEYHAYDKDEETPDARPL